MPIPVECPNCTARLNAPDSAAGKQLKCPKCATRVAVPDPNGFDVVEDVPPAVARPSRRRADEDDFEDERPRRKAGGKKRPARRGSPLPLLVGGGVVAVGLLVGGLWVAGVFKKGGGRPSAASGAPDGWDEVSDSDFRCLMPSGSTQASLSDPSQKAEYEKRKAARGVRTETLYTGRPAGGRPRPGGRAGPAPTEPEYRVHFIEFTDRVVGTTPEQLLDAAKTFSAGISLSFGEVASRTPVTVGGKPGVDIRLRPKGPDPRVPPEMRGPDESAFGEHKALLFVGDGKRLFMLSVERRGAEPDETAVKRFFDSFEVR